MSPPRTKPTAGATASCEFCLRISAAKLAILRISAVPLHGAAVLMLSGLATRLAGSCRSNRIHTAP